MNNFLEEKEKLLNSIENNTSEHWKEYYKNVPIDCIFDDLVIDINEIKRLTEENQKYKEAINNAINFIEKNKSHEYRNGNLNEYYLELNEKEMTKLLDILKEVE